MPMAKMVLPLARAVCACMHKMYSIFGVDGKLNFISLNFVLPEIRRCLHH